MILRTSSRGSFYGCSSFPRCRGTRKVGEETKDIPKTVPKHAPILKASGTVEQEAIWAFLLGKAAHVVVNAGPGTGKTWSAIQYCLRAPSSLRILFTAFNRHIAKEGREKFGATKLHNVEVKTSHSWGNGIVRAAFKSLGNPNESKMSEIVEQMHPAPLTGRAEWRKVINLADKMCGFAKNYLMDYKAADFAAKMEEIVDHHNADLDGKFALAMEFVPRALDICKERAGVSYDYDDMLWLPVVLDLPVRWPAEQVIADEYQDMNALQHELVAKMIGASGRAFLIGDRNQAINEFRGAMPDSMEVMAERLGKTSRGVATFPMTITQRCPQLNVRMAQCLFPNDIVAREDAPLGAIESMNSEKALGVMRPGDLVVCRCNAPLISAAYSLIRRGVRPVVKGRDIGKGLLTLLDGLQHVAAVIPSSGRCPDCDQSSRIGCKTCGGRGWIERPETERLLEALRIYRWDNMQKLLPLGDRAAGRIASLDDRCDCLSEFLHGVKTAAEARARIESIFQTNVPEDQEDESNAVIMGTVHRTKGLESTRVFVLAPELIPHPAARKPWEMKQEIHIAWIASTRTKFDRATGDDGLTVFCGKIPSVFNSNPRYPAPESDEPEKLETSALDDALSAMAPEVPADRARFLPEEPFDIHRKTAAEVLDIPEKEVTAEQRRAAKAANFGTTHASKKVGGKVGATKWMRSAAKRASSDMDKLADHLAAKEKEETDEPPF